MARTCAQALAIGLPAVAFTEHLEFISGGEGDAITGTAADARWWSRIKPLDVPGYLASVQECRERFPGLRILAGVEAGESHLFAGSAAAIIGGHDWDRILGSLHAVPYHGKLIAADALFGRMSQDDAMRYYFAELVRLIEGSDMFEVLAHPDFPRRYWPSGAHLFQEKVFEEEYRTVFRALAASGRIIEINTKSPLSSVELHRLVAGVRRPGGVVRQRRPPSGTRWRPVQARRGHRRGGGVSPRRRPVRLLAPLTTGASRRIA